jgi:D-lactate dehydrogenase
LNYQNFRSRLIDFIPLERIINDPLRTLAYGADASFYRLIPKIVVQVESEEEEVQKIILLSNETKIPITFRAAGMSLSGQAVTDSVMVRIVPSKWSKWELLTKNASVVRLQPGIIGGYINNVLAPFWKKIGPDPSSINACMIGGITANNSSGMCCGVSQNMYHTMKEMRLILADGTILDTSDPASKEEFRRSHASMLQALSDLSNEVKSNTALVSRIRQKYKIKNTTGYSLNALVDFTDPFDILTHLIIGSEGTLAFISNVTVNTVDELPFKASSLIIFPDLVIATEGVKILKNTPVAAVEILDGPCLRSVSNHDSIPNRLDLKAAALLIETRAANKEELKKQIQFITNSLSNIQTIGGIKFTDIPAEYNKLWDIRKGLIPSVGATRQKSTSVIIEDVAVAVPKLADFTIDLQELFQKYHYHDAIILGHALEGNL